MIWSTTSIASDLGAAVLHFILSLVSFLRAIWADMAWTPTSKACNSWWIIFAWRWSLIKCLVFSLTFWRTYWPWRVLIIITITVSNVIIINVSGAVTGKMSFLMAFVASDVSSKFLEVILDFRVETAHIAWGSRMTW